MKSIFTIIVVLFSIKGFAQTHTISNASISACAGTFVDAGGSGGQYNNNETFTYTICSSTAGAMVQVAFTSFATEAGDDVLTIYNGPNTASPIIGTYSGTTSPGTIAANNAGGCLTFRFTSDNNQRDNGWTATVSCITPPANDNCSGAISITPSTTCTYTNGTTAGATYLNDAANGGTPTCASPGAPDVWYSFTTTVAGTYIIDTQTGTITDGGMALYSGTCGALTQILCDDDSSPNGAMSMITANLAAATTYRVRIWAYGGSNTGTFGICVKAPTITNLSTCSGSFFDTGGNGGNYSNSEIQITTICPSTAGAKMQAIFSAFNTENTVDYLQIFDGNSTSAPSLGVYTGTTGPGTVQATPSNASGCLTFLFVSDGANTSTGWAATLNCIIPCQTITANLNSTNEAAGAGGIIRICQGQSVNFVGSGTFGTSGAGATYTWNMGNGVTMNGTNINYTWPAVGSYLVNLIITDPNGCSSSNYFNQQVQVSTTPTITTSATPSTLCTTQTSAFGATVTMNPYTVNCTPPVSGTTFLPDGSGVSYQTSIVTNCYTPGTAVTSVNDITNICLNMEHSFSGDLSIAIICPNGQSANLLTYPSGTGSANLGTPWATGTVDGSSATVTPGVGANYCFSMTGGSVWSTSAISGGTFPNGNGPGTYTDTYMAAGTYTPQASFASLIGCPLNGNWTIQVTDHLGSDNGYIFNWDINFAGTFSTASSFTPTIASQGWVPAATLVSTGPTTANVTPVSQGTPCYNYSVTDNFGCTYTSPQCITVNCGSSLPVGLVDFQATAVSNERVNLTWITSSETNSDYYTIERSKNGEVWEVIDQVDAAGNSTSTLNYSTVDESPFSGTSYYRLNQYDLDGSLATTDIEAVYLSLETMAKITLFPNPTSDLISVHGDLVSISSIRIFNALGQDMTQKVTIFDQGDNSVVISTKGLSSGVYSVKTENQNVSFIKL